MEGLISVELANRAAIEQSKINKTGPETAGVNDIGNMKMWLISNNIPAEHPAVQNLVKQMELHHRKYVTAYTQQVKDLARSERDLATKLKMAEEQGAMQTGLQGKMAEIERDKAIATMQADAQKTMYSGQLKERELALESLVKQAAVLRYGDLVLERDDANMREILDIAGSYVKAAAEQYVLEGKSVDDLLKEIVIPIIDQLSPQFRGEVEGEEKVTDKKKFRYNPKTQQMEPA